jgi:hypothetical protein
MNPSPAQCPCARPAGLVEGAPVGDALGDAVAGSIQYGVREGVGIVMSLGALAVATGMFWWATKGDKPARRTR